MQEERTEKLNDDKNVSINNCDAVYNENEIPLSFASFYYSLKVSKAKGKYSARVETY